METALKTLISYLPQNIVTEILKDPLDQSTMLEQRIPAVTVFADVTGFTAISESLAKQGREGAEELTKILNDYFTPMIQLITNYGGIVGKFGGDAMTILFPKHPSERWLTTIKRGVQCALEMQEKMQDFREVHTKQGLFTLQMKIGISSGEVYTTIVGMNDVRMEYVMAGKVLEVTVAAENHAESGDVVVDVDTLKKVSDAVVKQYRNEFVAVTGLSKPPQPRPVEKLSLENVNADQIYKRIAAYIPQEVFDRWMLGRGEFINEHRKVTVMFVNFSGLNYDNDPKIGEKLQKYFQTMLEVVRKYDGYINKIDIGDKGSKLLVLFGAPRTHENDEENALLCALEMQKKIAKLPFIAMQRIGINTGGVFAGNVGSQDRQEYTVMGDIVNLAARLMSAAQPGKVIITENTYQKTKRKFNFDELPPIRVKGKEQPVKIYELRRKAPESMLDVKPMIGRTFELEKIRRCLEKVKKNEGQVLSILGDAGMGKSRLNLELIQMAIEKHDFFAYGGECLSYGSNTPYLPWNNLFRTFFNLEIDQPRQEQIERIEKKVQRINPNLMVRIPLLSDILGIEIPDNEITEKFDANLRQQSLFNLVWELFSAEAAHKSLLLVIEDMHWIDPLSFELIEYIARNLHQSSIFLVLLSRPLEEPLLSLYKRATSLAHHTEIELGALSPEESVELVHSRLEIPDLPEAFKTAVLRKSQGNPFYVEELINIMLDSKVIIFDKEEQRYKIVGDIDQVEIPDNLLSLVMSRIDRLDESSKLTIKVASVIGRIFRLSMLNNIYPIEIDLYTLRLDMERLAGKELTPLDKPAPELEYLFKHIMTRDVAYESLLFSHRRELHEKTARYLEEIHQETIEEYYYILAHHYSITTNTKKQLFYFDKAGQQARRAYDNENAIYFFSKAIDLLKTLGGSYQSQLKDMMQNRTEVLDLTGNYERALADCEELLTLSQKTNDISFHIFALKEKGKIESISGKNANARQIWKDALTLAEEINDQTKEADLLNNIGLSHVLEGDFADALPYYEQALDIRKQLNDQDGIALSLMNIGTALSYLGEIEKALNYQQQAVTIYQQTKNKPKECDTLLNTFWTYIENKQVDKAIETAQKAFEIAVEIGYASGQGWSYERLGYVHFANGRYEDAITAYEKLIKIAMHVTQNDYDRMFASFSVAWMYLVVNQFQMAILYYEDALNVANDMENMQKQAFLNRWLGFVYQKDGDLERAEERFQRSLVLAQEIESKDEEAQTLNFIGLLWQARGNYRKALEYHQQAYEWIDDVSTGEEKTNICISLGDCLRKLGRLEEANNFFEKALAFVPPDDPDIQWQLFIGQARVLKELNQPKAALSAYQEAINILEMIRLSLKKYQIHFMKDKVQFYQEFITFLQQNHQFIEMKRWESILTPYTKKR